MADSETDMSYCLLGNETQKRFDQSKKNELKLLNSVITQARRNVILRENSFERNEERELGVNPLRVEDDLTDDRKRDEEGKLLLPLIQNDKFDCPAKVGKNQLGEILLLNV